MIDGAGSSVTAERLEIGRLVATFSSNSDDQSGTLTLSNGGVLTATDRVNVGKGGEINFDGGTLNSDTTAGEIALHLREAVVNITEGTTNQLNSNIIVRDGTIFNFKAGNAGVGRLDMDGGSQNFN